jgi:lipopolysaccharide transport system permease protein
LDLDENKSDKELVTVISSDKSSAGLVNTLKRLCLEVKDSRHVFVRLFLRDFKSQFQQKFLGYLWVILTPLFLVSSYLVLFGLGVLKPGEGEISYPLYVLIGSSIWSAMATAILDVSSSLQTQSDLILRTRIPKIAVAVSSLMTVSYGVITNMVVTLVVFAILRQMPSLWFIAYPVLVMPMLLIGFSIGLVLSTVGQVAKDLVPIVVQVVSLLMFVTPVVYLQSAGQTGVLGKIVDFNPLTYLVSLPRDLITTGHSTQTGGFLIALSLVILVFLLAVHLFYLLVDLVAERL